MSQDSGDINVALVFTLTSLSPEKANLGESCCDPEIRSTTGLPKNAKLQ